MRFVAPTLDDLCRKMLPSLLKGADEIHASRSEHLGAAHERRGVLLELRDPRARLSRTETRGKPFSCLGELLWYLSRDNRLEFIEHYIDSYKDESEDGETVHGGYGRRLFTHPAHDQIRTLIETLRQTPNTRRAVVQIFEAADTARRHKEVPCTLAMQFALRRNQLDLMVSMRSQDAYLGLPHDVFCFTMLQEIIARSINADIGEYKQFVGCLHLYDKHRAGAEQFLSERVQQSVSMPPMPLGDPWPSIGRVLEAEIDIRGGRAIASEAMAIDPYWLDLIRLLQVFAATGDAKMIRRLKNSLTFKGFCAYVDKRKDMKPRSPRQPSQPRLPF